MSTENIINYIMYRWTSVYQLGQNATYDKDMVKRLDDLENLPKEEKLRIFHYMDLIIRDFKTKATYATK